MTAAAAQLSGRVDTVGVLFHKYTIDQINIKYGLINAHEMDGPHCCVIIDRPHRTHQNWETVVVAVLLLLAF